MAEVTQGDLIKAIPFADKRLDNFMEAMTGLPVPKDQNDRQQALSMLSSATGIDLDEALKKAIEFQKMHPMKRFLMKHVINLVIDNQMGGYSADVINNRIPQINKDFEGATFPGAEYGKKMLSGISDTLKDPNLRGKLLKELTHFSSLEDVNTIPFVRSKINYMGE